MNQSDDLLKDKGWTKSDKPCRKCKKCEVWFYEIDDIYQDYRIMCNACDYTYVVEGPDY